MAEIHRLLKRMHISRSSDAQLAEGGGGAEWTITSYRVWAAPVAVGGGELYKPRASLLDPYLRDTQKPLPRGTGDMCKDINTTGLFIIRKNWRLSR